MPVTMIFTGARSSAAGTAAIRARSCRGLQRHVVDQPREVETAIKPAGAQQLAVRATFHYAPVVQHDDAVRMAHRREAMSDDDARASLHQAAERSDDLMLG